MKHLRIGSGVQFNELSPHTGRRLHLDWVGIDKQAHLDAGILHPADGLPQRSFVTHDIQPAFCGDFLPLLRNQTNDVRTDRQCDVDDLRGIGHFEIQAGPDGFPQRDHVSIDDVPTILPQVRRDAMGAHLLTQERGRNGIRLPPFHAPITGLTESGDVVDIDTQFQHVVFSVSERSSERWTIWAPEHPGTPLGEEHCGSSWDSAALPDPTNDPRAPIPSRSKPPELSESG